MWDWSSASTTSPCTMIWWLGMPSGLIGRAPSRSTSELSSRTSTLILEGFSVASPRRHSGPAKIVDLQLIAWPGISPFDLNGATSLEILSPIFAEFAPRSCRRNQVQSTLMLPIWRKGDHNRRMPTDIDRLHHQLHRRAALRSGKIRQAGRWVHGEPAWRVADEQGRLLIGDGVAPTMTTAELREFLTALHPPAPKPSAGFGDDQMLGVDWSARPLRQL